MKKIINIIGICLVFLFTQCKQPKNEQMKNEDTTLKKKVEQFAEVELNYDLTKFSDKDKKMLSLLFDVADIMDELFWDQTLGLDKKKQILDTLKNELLKKYFLINYGPWERLNDNKPFMQGFGEKPLGANYYPSDMTKEEFDKFENPDKNSLYTLIRRDENGKLKVVWYHEAYKEQLQKAHDLLMQASELTDNKAFQKYLQLRAKALVTSQYFESDMAWMDMKDNLFDFVVGPIESYDDHLFEKKAAFEAFILVKDTEWSSKLEKFIKVLPELQKKLPVDEKYKKETPGTSSDMNVYYVLYYAGDCNAGSKTIAINLPNDEQVQLKKGTRRLQLKNAMKAKFDKILTPIANMLIDETQINLINFDAFFNNVMFHEVAHGLGIKYVVNSKTTVREALKEAYSTIEECKADILGLYLVGLLRQMNLITEGNMNENYVTYVAGIFRSVRFGAASAHGKANLLAFNHFLKTGAIEKKSNGKYFVHLDKIPQSVESLVKKILVIQGDGNYEAAKKWIEAEAVMPDDMKKDLEKVNKSGIPVDIVFKQGKNILGLK
ncbi:MAG: Zn-dependent hydrolase [Bacteroidales bacterium]|nr:Zn-dependent hydrolase [Bacteroidales bacterium]